MARKSKAALLDELRASLNEGRVTELPLNLVQPDPGQPRRTFDEAALNDLAADIERNGVLQPITVDHTDKGWQIVMGERRWRAASIAKFKTIPALLVSLSRTDDDASSSDWQLERRLQQFAENHHRAPLPPMDLAFFLRSLRDDLKLTPTQIAASLKERGVREMGRSYVSNTIRLTELPEHFQQLIADRTLAPSHGKYLLMVAPLGDVGYERLVEELAGTRESLGDGERLIARDVLLCVGSVLRNCGYRLDGNDFDTRHADVLEDEGLPYVEHVVFDVGQCKNCDKRQPFTNWRGEQEVWCLDQARFLDKQRTALKAIAAGEVAPPEGVEVDLSAMEEGGGNDGHENDFEGSDGGSLPSGYTSPEQREANLRAKVHDHLVDWLRPRIVDVFAEEPVERSVGFVLWAALGFPRVRLDWQGTPVVNGEQPRHMPFDVMALAGQMGMCDPLQAGDLLMAHVPASRDYVPAAVMAMAAPSVWRWAIALGRDHLDDYALDAGYFDCCDKAEVEILARELGVSVPSNATKGKMITAILAKHVKHVPERVREVMKAARDEHRGMFESWAKANAADAPTPEQAAA